MSLVGNFLSSILSSPVTEAAALQYLGSAVPAPTTFVPGVSGTTGATMPAGSVSIGSTTVSYGTETKSIPWYWIIGGVLFLVLGGVLIAIFSKKKRK